VPNSTTSLQSVITYCRSFPDIAPLVTTPAGGVSNQPALTVASNVMTEILSPKLNWKYNRLKLPLFYTNSWQQDYALNVVNLGWLDGDNVIVDINNTQLPKPIWPLEAVKDLPMTSTQYGMPGQVCWLPNDQLVYGVWPGPGISISTPLGVTAQPANPLTQIQDPNGNFWVVTTYGVTGGSQPSWPTTLTFPTPSAPTTVATTQADGTVIWTALNPKGQGIRVSPLPPQVGVVYQFNIFGQWRPFAFSNGPFTSLSQTIEPIPDDFAAYFREGFVAYMHDHSTDSKIRAKASDLKAQWRLAMMTARGQSDRERDNQGFYPAVSLLQQNYPLFPGPSYPFPFGGG
jgi:hypothetical protein